MGCHVHACVAVGIATTLVYLLTSGTCFGLYARFRQHNELYATMTCTVDASWVDDYACQVACGKGGQCTRYCDADGV
jgi:hypothetical protein